MSRNPYSNTMPMAGPSSSSYQTPIPQNEEPSQMIPRPEEAYIKLDRLRTLIGIPERRLSVARISELYPDWPRDIAPDAAWEAIPSAVDESLMEYCAGVYNNDSGKLLRWSLFPGRDRASFQTPEVREAITISIFTKLSERGYENCTGRLSRCQDNWAIEDLLDKRVIKLRKRPVEQ
ncbi:hypothetical protein TWF281_007842 [Arthrobotrys megalospora]